MPAPRPLLIVHMAPTPNGAPWMVAFLQEQKRLGHEVSAIVPSLDGDIHERLSRDGIACHAGPVDLFSSKSPFDVARRIWRLARLLRTIRPDVIQGHIVQAMVSARIAAWLADVPLCYSMNTGPLSLELPPLRVLELGTAWMDTKSVLSCEYTRRVYREAGIGDERTALIYYAVDQRKHHPELADGSRLRRELGLSPDQLVVGIVAYFYPPISGAMVPKHLDGRGSKGHDVLIRAAVQVLREVPDAKFLIVGKSWNERAQQHEDFLRELVKELGLEKSVLFIGERHDVPDALASFDISVHCSLTENLGGTVESLLMARPMIVSKVGGMTDTVRHEETGLVVPPDDPPALSAAILRLHHDRALAQRLGESGRRLMLERFTLDRSIADLDALYNEGASRFDPATPPREQRYRPLIRAMRTVAFPFRIAPVVLRTMWIVLRGALLRRAAAKVRRFFRNRLKPSSPVARKDSNPLRLAQVAGAWVNCQWLVDLCRDQMERGRDVVAIIDAPPGDLADRLRAIGVRVHQIPLTFGTGRDRSRIADYFFGIPLAAIRLARVLRRERIDVVVSHIFTTVVIARLAAALARTSVHVAMIPGPRHLEARITRWVDSKTWWLDDATIAGCRKTQELYLQLGANPQKLPLAYYGSDPVQFDPLRGDPLRARRELGISEQAPLVSLIAHFYPPVQGIQAGQGEKSGHAPAGIKGHEYFLDAARLIANEIPSARFVCAGAGVTERGELYRLQLIEACRGDESLRDRVIFPGSHDDVVSLLAATDVAVQASLSENLGGTIEALLMARPLVATRVGGMPEAVLHEETGLLVDPADAEQLAAAIIRLLRNRDEGKEFGAAGRRWMLERFTFQRTADDLDHVIRAAVERRADLRPSESGLIVRPFARTVEQTRTDANPNDSRAKNAPGWPLSPPSSQ